MGSQNLKELRLSELPALKQLWKSSQNKLGKDFLPQLEGLYIRRCEMMEQVFLWKGEDGNKNNSCHHTTKMFPKLKQLELYELPNLISFCQGIEGIEFPLLRTIGIRGCGKMKGMISNGLASNENNSGSSNTNADTQCLFCAQQAPFSTVKEISIIWNENPLNSYQIHGIAFDRLEVLNMHEYEGTMGLFSSTITRNLVSLTTLSIRYSRKMVKVIEDEEEKETVVSGGQRALLFPKLRNLELWLLPELVSFCQWKSDVELPSLRELKIDKCHNMKSYTLGLLTTPNLKSVYIDYQDFGAVEDLNDFLQQQYSNRTKEKKQAEEA